MRSLASIVTVEKTQKMYKKDRIVCATFKEVGYEAIISNNINTGDKVCFIQEGSILPVIEEWEFLRKRCFSEKENGFIIKPMTMGNKELPDGSCGEKVKSWGVVIPLSDLPLSKQEVAVLKAGDDVTDALNIRKYEPEEDASPSQKSTSAKAYPAWVKFCLSKFWLRWIGRIWQKFNVRAALQFPSRYIEKSDETAVQNMKSVLEKFKDSTVYVTQKLEGQSCTALLDIDNRKHRLLVCSRNNAYAGPGNNFWEAAQKYSIEKKLKELYKATGLYYILQMEQCGPSIQNNIYKFKELTWFIYTVKTYNPKTKECVQLSWDKIKEIASTLGIETVPFVGEFKFSKIASDLPSLVKFAEEQYWRIKDGKVEFCYVPKDGEKLWEDSAQAEGIVIRSNDYDKSKNIGFSTKVKNLEYAEKGLGKISSIKWK